MGEDPSQIREEIEATRNRMSETADALAYKVSVRARVKEKVTAKKDAFIGRVRSTVPTTREEAVQQVSGTTHRLAGAARGVLTNPRQARTQSLETARRAGAAARRNRKQVAVVGGLAVLLGLRAYRRARRSDERPVTARTPGTRPGNRSAQVLARRGARPLPLHIVADRRGVAMPG